MAPSTGKQQQQQRAGKAEKRDQAVKSYIWDRKFDLLYAAFFIIHIPVMFCKFILPNFSYIYVYLSFRRRGRGKNLRTYFF